MSTANSKTGNTWWPKCRQWLIKRKNDWVRAIFMVIYLVILYMLFTLVVPLLVLVQFVSRLATGKANSSLSDAGAKLSDYTREIVRFISYKNDARPWPFAVRRTTRSGGSK